MAKPLKRYSSKGIISKKRQLWDAFPTRAGAQLAAASIADQCSATVRKLPQPQDGGRLKYGVYVPKSCRL